MALFFVIARTAPEKLRNQIKEEVYPTESIEFSSNSWFVYDTVTTTEVADKLKVAKGEVGSEGLVLPASGWTGYGPSAVWEWLTVRRTRESRPSG